MILCSLKVSGNIIEYICLNVINSEYVELRFFCFFGGLTEILMLVPSPQVKEEIAL